MYPIRYPLLGLLRREGRFQRSKARCSPCCELFEGLMSHLTILHLVLNLEVLVQRDVQNIHALHCPPKLGGPLLHYCSGVWRTMYPAHSGAVNPYPTSLAYFK